MDHLGDSSSLADKARCVGLLGAVLRDLSPFSYHPGDDRFSNILDSVMGIFEVGSPESIPFQDSLAAADALGQAGDPRLNDNNPEQWVDIPEGTCLLGAQKENSKDPGYDEEAYKNEVPVNEVFLDAFRIGRYSVTVSTYRSFVDHGGYENEDYWTEGGFSQFKQPENWENQLEFPNRPVVGVSWYEARAFCSWAGGRLPTEAEWERAARGGDGRKYPWGNQEPDESRLNFDSNIGHPIPVGLYPTGSSPEGLLDMAGNVVEWCNDWYDEDYYGRRPQSNPPGPKEGEVRVLRGGAWIYGSRSVRCALRNWLDPSDRSYNVGFRMVL